MENNTLDIKGINVVEMLKNIKVNVNVEGWPAAVAVISFCLSGVAIYGMSTYHKKEISIRKFDTF